MNILIKCDCGNEDQLVATNKDDKLSVLHDNTTKPIYMFSEGKDIKIKCLACNKEQPL